MNKKIQESLRQTFTKKLRTVSNYIAYSEQLPETLFMEQQLVNHYNHYEPSYQVNNSLKLKQWKSTIFHGFNSAEYKIVNQLKQEGMEYCLKVAPLHTHATVTLIFDEAVRKNYRITNDKAIVIREKDWKIIKIVVLVDKPSIYSLIKIQLDTMKIKQLEKMKGFSEKKKIRKEIEEYLKQKVTPAKIEEIKKRRQQSRTISRTVTMRRTMSNIIPRKSSQERVSSVQTKRDMIHFQKKKTNYFKHIEKMSPQKNQQIQEQINKYGKQLQTFTKNGSSLIYLLKFLYQMNKNMIKLKRDELHNIKISMLCRRFIKNLHKKIKTKLSHKAVLKKSLSTTFNLLGTVIHTNSTKIAENKIGWMFKQILVKKDLTRAAVKSKHFMKVIKNIQTRYRRNRNRSLLTFEYLLEILCLQLEKGTKKILYHRFLKKSRQQNYTLIHSMLSNRRKLTILKEQLDEEIQQQKQEDKRRKYLLHL